MFRFIVLTALIAIASANFVPQLDGRIVGGRATTIEQFPHQISLRRSGSHICGGSIYKANTIITAAHCVQGTSASSLSVVAGSTYRTSGGVSRTVSRVVIHPNYSSSTTNNDVAILILSSPYTYTSAIQPIALSTALPAAGTVTQVTGWGTTSEGGSVASTLQVVEVNFVTNADCARAYGSGSITSAMLCAGVDAGGKDACQGDSGGPLIQGGKLLGIVSWGYGCARKGYPGVYSSVPNLRNWIEANA